MINLPEIQSTGGNNPSKCFITMPDNIVYLKDANFATLRFVFDNNLYNRVKRIDCLLTLHSVNGSYRYRTTVYDYRLTFNINNVFAEAFKWTTDGNPNEEQSGVSITAISVVATIIGANGGESEFDIYVGQSLNYSVYDGYSLPNRAHGTDNAGFVPPQSVYCADVPEGWGCQTSHIGSIVTEPVLSGERYYPAGSVVPYYAPNEDDGCVKVTDVQKMVLPKNWKSDGRDWTFGIHFVMVDRIYLSADNFGLGKALSDAGFNTNYGTARYDPVSIMLEDTPDRGVWHVIFYSHREDDGQRHMIVYDDNWFIKEETYSLFGYDWYRGDANQYYAPDWGDRCGFKAYHNPDVHYEDGQMVFDIDLTTNVDAVIKFLVEFDVAGNGYETFTGEPLHAIRFYTDSVVCFDCPVGYDNYDYTLHYRSAETGSFAMQAKYWMFGNHLNHNDKDAESIWLQTDMEAMNWYYTINAVGAGLCQLTTTEDVNGHHNDGWYTYEMTNEGRTLPNFNSLWYHLWLFYNSNVVQRPLHKCRWDASDYSHTIVPFSVGRRTAQRLSDYCGSLLPWTLGCPMVQYYDVSFNITFTNDTTIETISGTTFFYPTYYFDTANGVANYTTNWFQLYDGVNYYNTAGMAVSEGNVAYVRANIRFYGDSSPLINFDFTNDDLTIDGNIAQELSVSGSSSLTLNYITIRGNQYSTYGAYQYMPFTCDVPFVKMGGEPIDSERCAQFSRVTVVQEQATPYFEEPHQILQLEIFYDTWSNLGDEVTVGGQTFTEYPDFSRNISRTHSGNDYNLTKNYDWTSEGVNLAEYTRFTTIRTMYDDIAGHEPSLHIQTFNEYGDGSFVLRSGCSVKSETTGGDIVNGDTTYFRVYTFGMCDATKPILWIKYKNMDGLWRYLPAEIVEQSYTNQRQDLQFIKPSYSPINAYPLWKPYSLEEKITVYLSNLPAEMHIEDILYSTPLELISADGSYVVYAALEEDTITRTLDGGENFVLHFIKKQ